MTWSQFQTATGILRKIGKSFDGSPEVLSSQVVEVDPVFGWQSAYDREGNKFNGKSTILTGFTDFDVSHENWELEYEGNTFKIGDLQPVYSIGGNVLEHLEVVLK